MDEYEYIFFCIVYIVPIDIIIISKFPSLLLLNSYQHVVDNL